MIAHCLFEQSGTFKNEFKKLGYEAYDYDILNDFGETDYQIDLFTEICNGYARKPSIFDNITPNDMILAFFPCTFFECQSQLWFAGNNYAQSNWSDEEKCRCAMERHNNLNKMYEVLNKLTCICLSRNLKMMIENPYNQPHYLTTYWCIKPKLIDKDRTRNGDYYTKPTQYWFINFEPKQNIVFEALDYVPKLNITDINKNRARTRSMIHPQYANRFIRQYLID